MIIVTSEPIDPTRAFGLIDTSAAGSVLFHYAVVKADGGGERPTCHIEYSRGGDIEAELETIAGELRRQWNLNDVLLVRRLGTLKVGEVISLVAVNSPGSEDAFAACREGIVRLKKMRTIDKREVCAASA